MTYKYEFDHSSPGDREFPAEAYQMIQEGLKQLFEQVEGWNAKVRASGAAPPYERETDDLRRLIAFGSRELARKVPWVRVSGISVGSLRYLKAGVEFLLRRKRIELEKPRAQGWPSAARETLRVSIEKVEKVASDLGVPPADVLWEVLPDLEASDGLEHTHADRAKATNVVDSVEYAVAQRLVERLRQMRLSKSAIDLLLEAAESGGELVLSSPRDGGQTVMVRSRRTFADDHDPSVQARYRTALKELVQLELVEFESGVVYRVTGAGWDVVRALKLLGTHGQERAAGSSDIRIREHVQLAVAPEKLQLHPAIAQASTELYQGGHYSNAIFDACKALMGLVKEKSGRADLDGAPLVRTVFSAKDPILAFNELKDQSDRDEQEGMMHLFEGAVLAIRNPRGHSFLDDSADLAFEYIAFLSMLANRLQTTKRSK